MTDQESGAHDDRPVAPDPEGPSADRRAAHERLSTGALARWARACATHPWRVVLGWVGIIVVLIVLVATVGGSLRDEFEIPGSDTQKATDLIESEFASEQGGVLNIVFAAPAGRAARHAGAQGGDREGDRDASSRRSSSRTDGKAGLDSVDDPFSKATFSKNGRIAYAEAQFDQTIEDEDRDAVVAVEDAVRDDRRAGGRDGRVQRRGRVPADRAGHVGAARPARGDHRAADRLPHVRRDADPDRAGDRGAGDGVPAAVHPRRPDRHQHGHADPGLDDRPRRRHRLLALHRHALQTAAPRGALAAGRRRRGRARPRVAPCSSPA